MVRFTENQQRAINLSDTSILVSAAAGSGKTAVLVERILNKIIVEKKNINEFLLVTFTKLAAKEMKEKIIKEIYNKLRICDECDKTHLYSQLDLINFAKITTIHAFCFDMIREYFIDIDVLPDFKIISGTEEKILKKQLMEQITDDIFKENADISNDFNNFISAISAKNLDDEMIKLYDFMNSYSRPNEILQKSFDRNTEMLKLSTDMDINEYLYSNEFAEMALLNINNAIKLIKKAQITAQKCPVIYEINGENIDSDLDFVEEIKYIFQKEGYKKAYEFVKSNKFVTLTSKRSKEKTDHIYEELKKIREKYKEFITIKAFSEEPITIEELHDQAKTQLINLGYISEIIGNFTNEYERIKKQKNVLNFSDAEHKMIQLLENSVIKSQISKKFTEIMVDEYQDTNEIQDTIFKKISKNEENLFMVGDLKQSIYKFRFADPTIFLRKLQNFVDDDSSNCSKKVSLNNNFRSNEHVIASVNEIFEAVMTEKIGGVNYNSDEQRLVFSANYYDNLDYKSEFILVNRDKIDEKNGEKTLTSAEIEGKTIANRIYQMISDKMQIFDKNFGGYRELRYSDIVILMRSTSSKAYFLKKAIENVGINVDFDSDASKVFNTPEILAIISFLKVLDNKKSKNDLIAIMKSEIFAFSNQEIVLINEIDRENFLHSILELSDDVNTQKYTHIPYVLKEKCSKFISIVNEIADFSRFNTVYKTLWLMITKLDIIAKFSLASFGEIRHKNIKLFINFVESIDESVSLFEFIDIIDNLDASSTKLTQENSSEGSVKIMTIHASKGLEFPVVFVCDIAKPFNMLDERIAIVKNNEFGIATYHTCMDGIVKYEPISRKIINKKNRFENISEEIRILYVALTRAKEKLILVGSATGLDKKIQQYTQGASEFKSYLDIVAPSILKSKSAMSFYDLYDGIIGYIDESKDLFLCNLIENLSEDAIDTVKKSYTRQNVYEYTLPSVLDIPSKITASEIAKFTPISAEKGESEENIITFYKKPKFLFEKKLSPTEKGTAHHIVMQFIDFSKCNTEAGIMAELERLFVQKFINREQKECIIPSKLLTFFDSDLGKLLVTNKYYREFNFSILVNSDEVLNTGNREKVLFQGVIDCLIENDDKIIIIDYKTDNVYSEEQINMATRGHKTQLDLYEKAVNEVFGKQVLSKYIYYFSAEKLVEV